MASVKKIIFSLGLSIFLFYSCKDNLLEKKGRLNPNDVQFERPLFRVLSVPSQSYVELKKKISNINISESS